MVRCGRFKAAPNPRGGRQALTVGLLGGSFNPAHDGHVHVALSALRLLRLDQVWLLVSPQNPLKDSADMAPLSARLHGARRQVAGHHRLIATDLERHLGTRYTIDTIRALKRRFARVRFVWLMGGDNLVQACRWRRWTHIWRGLCVAIVARPPYARNALAARAARRFARFRLPGHKARGLRLRPAPAWIYLHTRLHPASATHIRAGHGQATFEGENP